MSGQWGDPGPTLGEIAFNHSSDLRDANTRLEKRVFLLEEKVRLLINVVLEGAASS